MLFGDAIDLLASPLTHHRVTRETEHRPWPMPDGPWVMGQTWLDLLFAHWSVAPSALEGAVPSELELDTRDGLAWLAVTPFEVRNLRIRATFPVPFVSAFPEINVRTYVSHQGKAGIYFFSLDADSPLAVAAARRFYRLPYFRARMRISRDDGRLRYRSERRPSESAPAAEFRASYRPVGAAVQAQPGSLEHWLTERYCLYTLGDQRHVLRAEIHHPPWPLQPAEADLQLNTMATEVGLELESEPTLHFCRRQDVVFWPLERT